MKKLFKKRPSRTILCILKCINHNRFSPYFFVSLRPKKPSFFEHCFSTDIRPHPSQKPSRFDSLTDAVSTLRLQKNLTNDLLFGIIIDAVQKQAKKIPNKSKKKSAYFQ